MLSPDTSSLCDPLPVDQQRSLGRLERLNQRFEIAAKLCPDIKFFPMRKLTSKRFKHVATMQLARQTNGLCYVLPSVPEIVQVPAQIGDLSRYSKWVAVIRLLCNRALKIVILTEVDYSKHASRVLEPQADRLTKLLLHPDRSGSPLSFKSPSFGTRQPKRNNDGGYSTDCAHCIPVNSINILQRGTLRFPASATATLLHGAFQRPCWIVHLCIPLWIGRHFATTPHQWRLAHG